MFKYPVQLVNVFIIVHKYILILDVTGTVSACVSSVGRWSRLPARTSVRRLVRSLLPGTLVATLCCRAAGPAQPFLNFCCRGLQRQCVSVPPEPHFQKKARIGNPVQKVLDTAPTGPAGRTSGLLSRSLPLSIRFPNPGCPAPL